MGDRQLAEKISLANICIRLPSEGQWSPPKGGCRESIIKTGVVHVVYITKITIQLYRKKTVKIL